MGQTDGGDDLDRVAPEACVAGGDGPVTGSEPPGAPRLCRCRDCLFTRRTLRRAAVGRPPPVLSEGEGTYRLASWWSDSDGLDL